MDSLNILNQKSKLWVEGCGNSGEVNGPGADFEGCCLVHFEIILTSTYFNTMSLEHQTTFCGVHAGNGIFGSGEGEVG
jgi:hypothetical protein